jgi:ferredoxin hydrogenase large subunit
MNNIERDEHNFKEKVLYEVIKLCFEGKLEEEKDRIPYKIIPNSKAKYRCCVYKEREIVRQRVRLACGKNPLDGKADTTDSENGIIQIINAACEECPISRYVVTENCQCCISKRCKKACPFGAISIQGKRAYIEKELCRECGKCKEACPFSAIADLVRPCMKSCPVDAISMDSEKKAVIDYSRCINCGSCVTQCPFGAISEASSIVDVINMLKSDTDVYAVIAPSIQGQFKGANIQKIKQAIKNIGFKDVYEAAEGAEIVAREEAAALKDSAEKNGFMTSSCCPAFVSLIRKHYSDLEGAISHSESPMVETAKLVKNVDRNAKVVFIGPCIAKKAEILENGRTAFIDGILTFVELNLIFKVLKINPGDIPVLPENQEKKGLREYGRGFAISGGVSRAIRQAADELGLDYELNETKCNGIDECKRNLTIAEKIKPDFNFIEGMACKDGCIGGPCSIVSSNIAKRVIETSRK